MNKKGQVGFVTIVLVLFLGLLYFLGFAGMVGTYMQDQVQNNGLDGIYGFFAANINFFVAIIFVIVLLILARS